MQFMRYLASLFVGLVLLVVGAFLALSSGFSIFTAMTVHLLANEDLGEGVTISGLLSEGRSRGIDIFADPSAFAPVVIMFLGGLVLVVLGGRSLLHRLSAGLPDDDEGDAETSAGRLGQALVFGVGTVFGVVMLLKELFFVADLLDLKVNGVAATAVIEREWSAGETATKDDSGWFIAYSFEGPSGERVTAEQSVSSVFFKKYDAGSEIGILYAPEDPELNGIPEIFSLFDLFLWFGLYGVLVLFGVRGLRRNLELQAVDSRL